MKVTLHEKTDKYKNKQSVGLTIRLEKSDVYGRRYLIKGLAEALSGKFTKIVVTGDDNRVVVTRNAGRL